MAKRQAAKRLESPAAIERVDPFAPPAGTDLSYIPEPLRQFAVRCDSLTIDPMNVKDHGETDLPTHRASLKSYGIRRVVIGRQENRQITAGNGTVLASIKNGWEYVPVVWFDDDQNKARAYALADNAVATLAPWNESNLQKLKDESPALFDDVALQGLAESVLANIGELLEEQPEASEDEESKPSSDTTIMLSHRVIVMFDSQEKQVEFLGELKGRGIEGRLSTVQVK